MGGLWPSVAGRDQLVLVILIWFQGLRALESLQVRCDRLALARLPQYFLGQRVDLWLCHLCGR